jgi:hypothetical protein
MYKPVWYLCYIPGNNRVFRPWKDMTEQEAIVDYSTQIVDDNPDTSDRPIKLATLYKF